MTRARHLSTLALAVALWLQASPAAAEDLNVHLSEVRAVGPSLRASLDLRNIFTEKFRSILQDGGRLHLRVQAEVWEDRPLWDKLVRPAIVSVFRIIRDPRTEVTVSDAVGVVTTSPWSASALSLRVEVAPADAISDNRKYYVRIAVTIGTIEEKEIAATEEAVFGRGESAVSVARMGKVILNTVLQVSDYLTSVSAEMQGPVLLGRDLKGRR
jgi:hypothetical protein